METANEKKFSLSQLYIVDFAKYLMHKKNIFAVIYLLLNVVIITLFVHVLEPNIWLSILYGILIYAATSAIALSPLGEWIFRLMNGCKTIDDPRLQERLYPLFEEVKQRTQNARPDVILDRKLTLYISDNDDINAFAMGRRTVCVTRGLLSLSDEEIKAVLGHEFGHLATHDTDLTLMITVGNFMISAIVTMVRIGLILYNLFISLISIFMGDEGALFDILNAIATFISTLCINGLMWLWTQLGILLVMKSSREAEYEADLFSCSLGYSDSLLSFFHLLENMEGHSHRKDRNNVFAALSASHPDTCKRIARIECAFGDLSV